MDMGRKKRGLIIICLVLLATLVTGLAFAVNSMGSIGTVHLLLSSGMTVKETESK